MNKIDDDEEYCIPIDEPVEKEKKKEHIPINFMKLYRESTNDGERLSVVGMYANDCNMGSTKSLSEDELIEVFQCMKSDDFRMDALLKLQYPILQMTITGSKYLCLLRLFTKDKLSVLIFSYRYVEKLNVIEIIDILNQLSDQEHKLLALGYLAYKAITKITNVKILCQILSNFNTSTYQIKAVDVLASRSKLGFKISDPGVAEKIKYVIKDIDDPSMQIFKIVSDHNKID